MKPNSVFTRRSWHTLTSGLIRLGVMTACLFAHTVSAEEVHVVLLHTADLHGRVMQLVDQPEPETHTGGLLRLATLIRRVRAESPHVLLVDAGDTVQGSPESFATFGREFLASMERLGYDAWAIGNHEFDWGLDRLRDLVRHSRVPALAANLHPEPSEDEAHPLPGVRPYVVHERAGLRVVIVGLTTPGIDRWFLPELVSPAETTDSILALRTRMPELRALHPDMLILVLHQGYRGGLSDPINHAAEIMHRFPEFDVVIGGHTHEQEPGILVNGVLYAQAGAHGEVLGRVDLIYDRATRRMLRKEGRMLEAGPDVPMDPEEKARWRPRIEKTRAHLDEVVGRLEASLSPRHARPGHSGIERLLREAIGEAVGADMVIHGTLVPRSLNAGPVTRRTIWRIVPYENRIGIAHLTAEEIRDILEEIWTQPTSPRFMGISGAIVDVRPDAEPGRRIADFRLADGRQPHPHQRYKVALNSYTLASGGGRFPRLREIVLRPEARFVLTEMETREAVRRYVSTRDAVDLSAAARDGYRLP